MLIACLCIVYFPNNFWLGIRTIGFINMISKPKLSKEVLHLLWRSICSVAYAMWPHKCKTRMDARARQESSSDMARTLRLIESMIQLKTKIIISRSVNFFKVPHTWEGRSKIPKGRYTIDFQKRWKLEVKIRLI
mgnify:CR=1 FL=1